MSNEQKPDGGSVGLHPIVGPDPTCGSCSRKRSEHHDEHYGSERRLYCYTNTNGDVFTDEPGDNVVLAMLIERKPEVYDELIAAWKAENGHEPNARSDAPGAEHE